MRTRQKPRKSIVASGNCRSAHGMQWEVALFDLSEGGCRIEDPKATLRKGEMVKLFISGTGPHRAHVRWRDGGQAGLAFVRPLTAQILESLCRGEMIDTPSGGWNLGPKRMVC